MCKQQFRAMLAALLFALSSTAHAQLADIFRLMEQYGTQKQGASKVLASQISVAATAQINADIAIAQGAMVGRALLSTTVEQVETYRSFSGLTGQGAQVCDAVSQRNDIDDIDKKRSLYSFTSQPRAGRSAIPPDRYESTRTERRLDAYCSADEHNLGLCKSRFDGMNTASTNYTKFALADQLTSKQLKAAEDFIANLVPRPSPVRRATECDVGCRTQLVQAMRLDAVSSMVAVPVAASLSGRIGAKTFAEKN